MAKVSLIVLMVVAYSHITQLNGMQGREECDQVGIYEKRMCNTYSNGENVKKHFWRVKEDCEKFGVSDEGQCNIFAKCMVFAPRMVWYGPFDNRLTMCQKKAINTNCYYGGLCGNFGSSSCRSGIHTIGGDAGGACCVFPFTYNGNDFYSCTKKGSDKYWCYTSNVGKWGVCPGRPLKKKIPESADECLEEAVGDAAKCKIYASCMMRGSDDDICKQFSQCHDDGETEKDCKMLESCLRRGKNVDYCKLYNRCYNKLKHRSFVEQICNHAVSREFF